MITHDENAPDTYRGLICGWQTRRGTVPRAA
jgi:hypothetical protein